MKSVIGLALVAYVISRATSSNLPILPVNPGGIGGLYRGPNSETIIKGPDGSIITSEAIGGTVQANADIQSIIVAEPLVEKIANVAIGSELIQTDPLVSTQNIVAVSSQPILAQTVTVGAPHLVKTELIDAPAIESDLSAALNGPSGLISTRGSSSIVSGPASTTITVPARPLIPTVGIDVVPISRPLVASVRELNTQSNILGVSNLGVQGIQNIPQSVTALPTLSSTPISITSVPLLENSLQTITPLSRNSITSVPTAPTGRTLFEPSSIDIERGRIDLGQNGNLVNNLQLGNSLGLQQIASSTIAPQNNLLGTGIGSGQNIQIANGVQLGNILGPQAISAPTITPRGNSLSGIDINRNIELANGLRLGNTLGTQQILQADARNILAASAISSQGDAPIRNSLNDEVALRRGALVADNFQLENGLGQQQIGAATNAHQEGVINRNPLSGRIDLAQEGALTNNWQLRNGLGQHQIAAPANSPQGNVINRNSLNGGIDLGQEGALRNWQLQNSLGQHQIGILTNAPQADVINRNSLNGRIDMGNEAFLTNNWQLENTLLAQQQIGASTSQGDTTNRNSLNGRLNLGQEAQLTNNLENAAAQQQIPAPNTSPQGEATNRRLSKTEVVITENNVLPNGLQVENTIGQSQTISSTGDPHVTVTNGNSRVSSTISPQIIVDNENINANSNLGIGSGLSQLQLGSGARNDDGRFLINSGTEIDNSRTPEAVSNYQLGINSASISPENIIPPEIAWSPTDRRISLDGRLASRIEDQNSNRGQIGPNPGLGSARLNPSYIQSIPRGNLEIPPIEDLEKINRQLSIAGLNQQDQRLLTNQIQFPSTTQPIAVESSKSNILATTSTQGRRIYSARVSSTTPLATGSVSPNGSPNVLEHGIQGARVLDTLRLEPPISNNRNLVDVGSASLGSLGNIQTAGQNLVGPQVIESAIDISQWNVGQNVGLGSSTPISVGGGPPVLSRVPHSPGIEYELYNRYGRQARRKN